MTRQGEIAALARRYGGTIVNARGTGHPRILLGNGAVVVVPATPSDNRVLANIESQLRRAMVRGVMWWNHGKETEL